MDEPRTNGSAASDFVELKELAAILWRRKWLIALITLLAAATAYAISSLAAPIYESSTVLFVNQVTDPRRYDSGPIPASDRLARTYAEMLTTRPMVQETLARLGPDVVGRDPHRMVDAELVADTQLIRLKVQASDPAIAADFANTLVAVFADQFDSLQATRFAASKASLSAQLEKLGEQITDTEIQIELLKSTIEAEAKNASQPLSGPGAEDASSAVGGSRTNELSAELQRRLAELSQYRVSYTDLLLSYEDLRITEAQSTSSIVQVEPAEPPGSPVRPRTTFNTLVATAVGLAIAAGAAIVVDRLDDTLRTAEAISRAARLPIVGNIANSKKLATSDTRPGLMLTARNTALAESFRTLRTNLELGGRLGTPRSILIGSPGPGDGKTTIAAQLAVSMAQGGKRVILVDANLRRPGLHAYFKIQNKLGLTDMLIDDLIPKVVAQQVVHWRLRVITSGKAVDNPAELMGSIMMLKVLARLRDEADVAIFDGPPFLVAESFVLASKLESVLIVMQPGRIREAQLQRVMEQLERAKANLFGVVTNRIPRQVARSLSGYLIYNLDEPGGDVLAARSPQVPGRRPVVLRSQQGQTTPFVEETRS